MPYGPLVSGPTLARPFGAAAPGNALPAAKPKPPEPMNGSTYGSGSSTGGSGGAASGMACVPPPPHAATTMVRSRYARRIPRCYRVLCCRQLTPATFMRVHTTDHHVVPLPPRHRFPMTKYAKLRGALLARGAVRADELVAVGPAPVELVELVHERAYVRAVVDGSIDPRAMRTIGFPWSEEVVRRSLTSVHGTVLAARDALAGGSGIGANLAGGTHHAFRDRGAGYCVFNDLAIAATALLGEGRVRRVLIVDVDVHQGDGTAAIFAGDDRVFTCSLHGARNFPFRKERSDLDVELPDGTEDAAYLAALTGALEEAWRRARPEVVFLQGGVDGLREDKLGRLALTHAGLRARDRLILETAKRRAVPIVLTLGGGYAEPIDASVEGHVGTYEVARSVFGDA